MVHFSLAGCFARPNPGKKGEGCEGRKFKPSSDLVLRFKDPITDKGKADWEEYCNYIHNNIM